MLRHKLTKQIFLGYKIQSMNILIHRITNLRVSKNTSKWLWKSKLSPVLNAERKYA